MGKQLVSYFVVDAFTEEAYKGNPAAVCFLEEDRSDKWLQSVAAEFNISISCFVKRLAADSATSTPRFHLRWFSPVVEVKLCGHATLAASHILFTKGFVDSTVIEFVTLSGSLKVKKVPIHEKGEASGYSSAQNGEEQNTFYVELDFPADSIIEPNSTDLESAKGSLGTSSILAIKRAETFDDILVEVPSIKDVLELRPNFDEMMKCSGRGVIVTSVGAAESGFDFCSRAFFPKFGVREDPVCGTAHCSLATYWSEKLGKCDFMAYAASSRSGILSIHLDKKNKRILMRGKAVTVMDGSLLV